jgi:hypothetical protein
MNSSSRDACFGRRKDAKNRETHNLWCVQCVPRSLVSLRTMPPQAPLMRGESSDRGPGSAYLGLGELSWPKRPVTGPFHDQTAPAPSDSRSVVKPLCGVGESRRAGERERSWSPRKPPNRARRRRPPTTAPAPKLEPTCPPWPTGRSPYRPSSSSRDAPARHPTAPQSGPATRSPQPPSGVPTAGAPSPSLPETTARSQPKPHQKSHRVTRQPDSPIHDRSAFSNTP